MLNVDTIKNGLVIDHINAGYGPKIFQWLGLDKAKFSSALIMNIPSKKIGKKDIDRLRKVASGKRKQRNQDIHRNPFRSFPHWDYMLRMFRSQEYLIRKVSFCGLLADYPPGPSYEVVWENVTYSYPGVGTTALRQVNARACAGRWTCLVGTSGSGKSTLAHLALRFDDPQDGRVLIDGVDIRELTGESLRRQVGLVSQRTHLFRASIEDNVRLAAPGATHEEVVAACCDAGIHEDIEALEEGYQTLVGERGALLSGGQRVYGNRWRRIVGNG